MRRLWLLGILFLAPSVSGCGCDLILRTYLDPTTLTLTVGETAPPPRASVSACAQPRHTVSVNRWESENPAIASVNEDTGVITGVAPGETRIAVYGNDADSFFSVLPVTVASP